MSGISNTKTPFAFAIEDELSICLLTKLIQRMQRKQISYAEKRVKMFASSAGELPIETMNETELHSFLAKFYAGLRKENGSTHWIRYSQ